MIFAAGWALIISAVEAVVAEGSPNRDAAAKRAITAPRSPQSDRVRGQRVAGGRSGHFGGISIAVDPIIASLLLTSVIASHRGRA